MADRVNYSLDGRCQMSDVSDFTRLIVTHKPVFLKVGRFGPYVQRGTPDDDEKPKNASLLKGMTPDDVTLDVALKLLSLPRTLGNHPELNEPVVAQNGRFGPYIQCGKETRSLPPDLSPLDATLDQAIELLAQPKTRGRGRGAPKEPLKVFEASPVTDQPIKLLEGRYGPYVTDGQTNASLPKGADPDELKFDQAVDLLAARAAKGGTKKKKQAAKKKTKAAKKTARQEKNGEEEGRVIGERRKSSFHRRGVACQSAFHRPGYQGPMAWT